MSETRTTGTIENAERLKQLPPYLFVELDQAKQRLEAQGHDVIDLGVGDPDLPTPPHIIARLKSAVDDPANHRYSFTQGLAPLRKAIADWYQKRFSVTLDPASEVLPLLGSKEGIAHFPLALANPGESVLVPDPCYPPYRSGAILAGAKVVSMPLLEENQFLPDFGAISQKAVRQAKLLFLNYPNNPTASVATDACFQEAIEMAREYGFVVAHDAAYSEIAFDGTTPKSFLQMPGAKEAGVEFHSLSKTYNMTGWRVGFVCGNAKAVAALSQLKTNLDSGIFQPVQLAAIEALEGDQQPLADSIKVWQQRRDLVVDGLAKAGWRIPKPSASFYLWSAVPGRVPAHAALRGLADAGRSGGSLSMDFAKRAMEQAHVVVTPGVGFGSAGEGYVRLSLTVPTPRLEEAVARLAKIL